MPTAFKKYAVDFDRETGTDDVVELSTLMSLLPLPTTLKKTAGL